MSRSPHAPYGIPDTYPQCAHRFGWDCHRIGVGKDGNPFRPGSDEHEAYNDAQEEREEAVNDGRLLILPALAKECPV